jgi:hypothetical protein
MRALPPLLAAVLLLAGAAPAHAQVVRGRVIDNATGEPVSAAKVEALAAGRGSGSTRSEADGKFEVRLRAAGTFRLQTERSGYRPTVTGDIPVAVRETVYVEVKVAAAAMQLDPLRVTARVAPPRRRTLELNGFYERERLGFGRFIRREDFETRSNLTTSQILARERGTIVVGSGPSEFIVFARSSSVGALRSPVAKYCIPQLYLDGMKISSGRDLNEVVGPNQVEAVELYRSAAEIPVQYNGSDSACGVILVWTRHEP